jgi:hydroxyacylglutathione hydrolase
MKMKVTLTVCFMLALMVPVCGQKQNQETWFKASQVADKVWVIDDHGNDNMYLVEGKSKALLIDTGIGMGDLAKFVKSLTSLPVSVVNTHGHPDHAGGNYQFKTVSAHPADFELIKLFSGKEYLKNSARRALAGTPIPGTVTLADIEASQPPELRAVKEGDIFDLGDRKLEVVEVPGHTRGSICLLDSVSKLIFTGDNDNSLVWLFLKDCTPLEVYLQTLEKLQVRNADYDKILPGHGTPLDKDFVGEQIACVKSILDGSCTAEPYQSFAGNASLCRYKRAAVAFDPQNLHSAK